ncbi:MAG: tRNA pseudouridine(13) synthase TruD [Promethearchaeota archaeon]
MSNQEEPTYIFDGTDEKEVEKFVGINTYSTSKIQGIKGDYKTIFKDFIVKEIDANGKILDIKEDHPSPAFSEDVNDKFSTFNLIKINNDTFEAINRISKALNIPISSFNYSGLKDKHAVSVQKISIRGNYVEQLKKLNLHDIFIRNIYPTKKPVKLGSHLGNNFTIVIRNIDSESSRKQKVNGLLDFLNKFGFPNYFGLQRFGNYRPNSHIVGRYLLLDDYENAFEEYVSTTYSTESAESIKARSEFRTDKNLEKAYNNFPKNLNYEKKMLKYLIKNPGNYKGAINTLPNDLKRLLISSFQSYLFNKMLSLRVEKGYPLFKPIEGDVICILDDFNGNITPVKYKYGESYDKYLEKALKLNRASIVLPLIGRDTDLYDFPLMQSLFREVVEMEGIDETIFQRESNINDEFKGSIRAMTVRPTDLKLIELTDDELNPGKEKMKIEFSLQKGCYATMLIRELIK